MFILHIVCILLTCKSLRRQGTQAELGDLGQQQADRRDQFPGDTVPATMGDKGDTIAQPNILALEKGDVVTHTG